MVKSLLIKNNLFSELCEAATKIQATFRGHKQRKQTEEDKLSSEMEKAKVKTSKFKVFIVLRLYLGYLSPHK